MKGRVKCTVWSRVCGYLRPTTNWNEGKIAEFEDRKLFTIEGQHDENSKPKHLNSLII